MNYLPEHPSSSSAPNACLFCVFRSLCMFVWLCRGGLVLAADSTDSPLRDSSHRGHASREFSNTLREMLQDFARNLKDQLPSDGLTLARVAQLLRAMRGFIDTADVIIRTK